MTMNINRNDTVNRYTLNIFIGYNLNWKVLANIKMEEKIE